MSSAVGYGDPFVDFFDLDFQNPFILAYTCVKSLIPY
jgi:hypothetical protein